VRPDVLTGRQLPMRRLMVAGMTSDARLHEGERPMFIFNRPVGAVLVTLAVPVLIALLDGLTNFSAM